MNTIVVIAKAPVPGRVKTRLSPALSPASAAAVAAAALADTLDAVRGVACTRRVLALAGALAAVPPGFEVIPQRGHGLGERLAAAFADAGPGPVLLVGMDTPQLSPAMLGDALLRLACSSAVIGPAADGGWWALGLRDTRHAAVLSDVPMSRPDTFDRTIAALRGVSLARLPVLRDVDTIDDARSVAAAAPATRFARALAGLDAVAAQPA